jgi:hypothetical protein
MCAKHLLSSASALIDNTMPHPRHLHRRLAAHNGQPKQGGAMYRPATFGLCLPDRRVATRFEKTARNHRAVVTLAAIILWMR